MAITRNPSTELRSRGNRCSAALPRYGVLVAMGLLLVAVQGQGQQQHPGPKNADGAALHPGFEALLRGADAVRRDDLDRGRQRLFDRIAKRLGVTDGLITRAQLYELSNAPQPSGASEEMPAAGTAASPAGAPPVRNGATGVDARNDDRSTGLVAPAASRQETKAPLVYHGDNLPRELPPWFRQLDTNHDAQVGLYEWRVSGRSIAEFERIDRNKDGFLTVEEVLYYLRQGGDLTAGSRSEMRRLDPSRR